MESATVAAQGYRFRVPYGTLLCVSDKPLHGEIKLPGQANAFYERAISQHLRIGIEALRILQARGRRSSTRASCAASTSRRSGERRRSPGRARARRRRSAPMRLIPASASAARSKSVDGEVAVGANMENACYRLGVCAEIAALTAAQQAFGLARIARIAVDRRPCRATARWPATWWSRPAAAAASRSSRRRSSRARDIEMVSANGDGSETRVDRISALIPHGFGPANLKDAG